MRKEGGPSKKPRITGPSDMGSSRNTDNSAHGKKLCDAVYSFSEPKGQVDVEIVFIHSLELDGAKEAYWKTWLARDGNEDNCWPQTWLVEEFPHARILSISYDAHVEQTLTSGRVGLDNLGDSLIQELTLAGVGQHECPLMFVCHGFGGLVAKQIVVSASHNFQRNNEAQKFLRNLRGFYFYATPHVGAEDYFSSLNPFFSKGVCVSYLKAFSPDVGRLNSKFEQIRHEVYNNGWMFFNVGEMHATSHGKVIVPESSARQPGVSFLPISANHFDICRPQSKIDTSYQSLKKHVLKVMKFHDDMQPCLLDLPKGLVGMDDKAEYIFEKLKTISIFGLVGMGGIGKTTISKYVYNSQAKFYDKTCFLQDVRSKEMASIQKDLFLELCGRTGDNVQSLSSRDLGSVKQCIKRKRVLVVIDDVEKTETLKGLQVSIFQRSISPGSHVIVTCRNRQVLDDLIGLEQLQDVEIMDVGFLTDSKALELFHFHVFSGIHDKDEMEDFRGLAIKIVETCGGLPLSLEVIGQHLRKQHAHRIEKRMGIWEEALKKLCEAEPFHGGNENEVLWKKLKISYDDLTLDAQSMFLDLVCFFSGDSFYAYGEQSMGWIWNLEIGLQNLCERSLIKVDGDHLLGYRFTIHDQLRDMGRRIVKDLSLEGSQVSLEKATRLWRAKEVVSFLEENEGSRFIEGISLRDCLERTTLQLRRKQGPMQEATIQRFERLRLLDLPDCGIEIVDFCLKRCWEKLSWLCLDRVDFTSTPLALEAIGFCTELRVLQMRFSYMKELPASIGNLVQLLELDLYCSRAIGSLPFEIGNLKQLKRLELSSWHHLEELPSSVSKITTLQYLGLSNCMNLVKMVEFETQMDRLYELDLKYCSRLRIFKSLGKLYQLRTLNMKGCRSLTIENPCESFGHLSRLERLNLVDCDGVSDWVSLCNGEFTWEGYLSAWNLLRKSFSPRLQEFEHSIYSKSDFPHILLSRFLRCPEVFKGQLKQFPTIVGEFIPLERLIWRDGCSYPPDLLLCLVRLEDLTIAVASAFESSPYDLGYALSQEFEYDIWWDYEGTAYIPWPIAPT